MEEMPLSAQFRSSFYDSLYRYKVEHNMELTDTSISGTFQWIFIKFGTGGSLIKAKIPP
jgi:hypothetical protein